MVQPMSGLCYGGSKIGLDARRHGTVSITGDEPSGHPFNDKFRHFSGCSYRKRQIVTLGIINIQCQLT